MKFLLLVQFGAAIHFPIGSAEFLPEFPLPALGNKNRIFSGFRLYDAKHIRRDSHRDDPLAEFWLLFSHADTFNAARFSFGNLTLQS